MLNDFTGADQVYIACGYTDLRTGIDGLARLVQQQFELDPFTNTLFLFCGRRRDRIKGLYWEKDGFILLYKRLEQGAYQWPRSESEVKVLTPQQYRWLMEGLQIEQPKAHRPVTGLSACSRKMRSWKQRAPSRKSSTQDWKQSLLPANRSRHRSLPAWHCRMSGCWSS